MKQVFSKSWRTVTASIVTGTMMAMSLLLTIPSAHASDENDNSNQVSGYLQNTQYPVAQNKWLSSTGSSWVDNTTTKHPVEYPKVGTVGPVLVNNTCVSTSTTTTAYSLTAIPVGDGSKCLRFRSEVISDGFFTFRVEHPGAPTDGHYLGDGSRGGILDLIPTTPEMTFAIDEDPEATAHLQLSPDSNNSDPVVAGDKFYYDVVVNNTGNVGLKSFEAATQAGYTFDCNSQIINSDEIKTCRATAPLVITQEDIDKGSITGTITEVSALTPKNVSVTITEDGPWTQTITLSQIDSLDATAEFVSDGNVRAGDEVVFKTTVTNQGNSSVSNLSVDGVKCGDTPLLPGDSRDCEASVSVSQTEIDSGKIERTVQITGSAPSGNQISTTASSELRVTASHSVESTYSLIPDAYSKVDDILVLTLQVKNTGNQTMSDLSASDGSNFSCNVSSLVPDQSAVCTRNYAVTQADIDRGFISSEIAYSGKFAGQAAVTEQGRNQKTVYADIDATYELKVIPSVETPSAVGDQITYTATVFNKGNVSLQNLEVSSEDAKFQSCDETTIAPGASANCTFTRAIDQDMLESRDTQSSFTATARSANQTDVVLAPQNAVVDLKLSGTVSASVSLSLTAEEGTIQAGDVVKAKAIITNNGNINLSGAEIFSTSGDSLCTATPTVAGQEFTCEWDHTVSIDDIDNEILSVVIDSKVYTQSYDPITLDETKASIVLEQEESLSANLLVSSSDTSMKLGTELSYTLEITNNGNATYNIADVEYEVEEDSEAFSPIPFDGNSSARTLAAANVCSSMKLAPGESAQCKGKATLTQKIKDAEKLTLWAKVHGSNGNSGKVKMSALASSKTNVPANPSINISVKSSEDNIVSGSKVTYWLTVTNTGDVTLRDFAVRETISGTAVKCPVDVLAPGEVTECEFVLTATVNGQTVNFEASGITSQGVLVDSASETLSISIQQKLAKTGSNALIMGAIAVLIAAGGVGIVLVSRRKRNQ